MQDHFHEQGAAAGTALLYWQDVVATNLRCYLALSLAGLSSQGFAGRCQGCLLLGLGKRGCCQANKLSRLPNPHSIINL
eukprot:5329895-Amphidinium_carterae.1